jgi:hypothetical protein
MLLVIVSTCFSRCLSPQKDADHNGALNIAQLGEDAVAFGRDNATPVVRGVVVNQPKISTMFCSLQDVVRDKALASRDG